MLLIGQLRTIPDDRGQAARCPLEGDRNLSDEGLAEHLNRLRAQAGNPSVRDLAKLTERREPGRAMSRSTIQDKLSGKNLPRMWQTLAFVRACADYAVSIGITLPDMDTDERVWRERTQAAWAQAPLPAADAATTLEETTAPEEVTALEDLTASPRLAPETAPETESPTFSLDPLIKAGLHDMVELLQDSEGQATASWLPTLVETLREAEMSNEQFLLAASTEKPQDVAQNILSLAHFGEDQALHKLIVLTAVNQPPESIPIILAFLRRHREGGTGIRVADKLVSAISGKLSGSPYIATRRYTEVAYALRAATMENDVTRLLTDIGEQKLPQTLLEVAASFSESEWRDRDLVLESVAKGNRYHISLTIKALSMAKMFGLDPAKVLDRIIFGIPDGQHAGIAEYLRSQGLSEAADRVLELEDQPPF